MNNEYACAVCSAHRLSVVDGFSSLPRVTSDSRYRPSGGILCVCEGCGTVQKLPTDTWHNESAEIYSSYDLWPLAKGKEQPIFTSKGEQKPRSNLLIEFLLDHLDGKNQGELLDVGCGTGAALVNFSRMLPSWNLYAYDISDRFLPKLKPIPTFKELFVGQLENIQHRFDMITMIHSLEHIPQPFDSLCWIRKLLKENGTLMISVPNGEVTPFDYLVIDHRTHFSPKQLALLAQRAGFKIHCLRDDLLPKEIDMLAKPADDSFVSLPEFCDVEESIARVNKGVEWLATLLWEARESANQAHSLGKKFGIFGTAISGMWLFGALEGRVDFFVDEDLSRQGVFFEGHPIVAPENVPSGATVFLALLPDISVSIKNRLTTCPGSWILPPPRC